MNKPAEEQGYQEDRNKWLTFYPKEAGERITERIYLEDYFDRESIEIDKLVYLALQHRPGFQRESQEEMDNRQRSYLKEAFGKFEDKCKRENITNFEDYDAKYKIHYKSREWMEALASLLKNVSKKEYRQVKSFVGQYQK